MLTHRVYPRRLLFVRCGASRSKGTRCVSSRLPLAPPLLPASIRTYFNASLHSEMASGHPSKEPKA
eukprot:880169-Alexandrium_andersonii.AAC.1